MKAAVIGVFTGLVVAWLAGGGQSPWPQAEASPGQTGSSEWIALPSTTAEGRQQVTILDPRRGAMGVYQIEPSSGEIALRSVRNIQWDLQLSEFNSGAPLPREIRSLIEQR